MPVEHEQPIEDAKILIGLFKEMMKDKSVFVKCPAYKTLFCKILVDRQLIEFKCSRCTKKWQSLSKGKDISVFHRFNKKGDLVETVIVEQGNERPIDKI